MKPIAIRLANVLDDFKSIAVNVELTDLDKSVIHKLHKQDGREDYDYQDVCMLVFVAVNGKTDEVIGINSVSYYPENKGEYDFPWALQPSQKRDILQFVHNNIR